MLLNFLQILNFDAMIYEWADFEINSNTSILVGKLVKGYYIFSWLISICYLLKVLSLMNAAGILTSQSTFINEYSQYLNITKYFH